jgi:hypothetical protein
MHAFCPVYPDSKVTFSPYVTQEPDNSKKRALRPAIDA